MNHAKVRIGDRSICLTERPFVIAEMSGNHNQSLERALEIVDAAATAGVDGLKLQTYTPDTMTLKLNEREFRIDRPDSLWVGRSLYELYSEAQTPWEWHAAIFERARNRGLIPFSTPFDATAVEFLESIDAPCYKIASFENTDLPLIRLVARTGKPVILSTGMATLAELAEAVHAFHEAGGEHLVLLKCTSTYPATPVDTNLRTLPHLRELFACEVGLSDHTMGIGAAVAAVALGASVVEKHFTLRRADGGVDSTFSLEPDEMAQLVVETERAWQALGRVTYGPLPSEVGSRQFRRSLYLVRALRAGDVIDRSDVRAIRPGFGLPPKYLEQVIGRRIARDITPGTALTWDLLS